jgi:hypothetical protein
MHTEFGAHAPPGAHAPYAPVKQGSPMLPDSAHVPQVGGATPPSGGLAGTTPHSKLEQRVPPLHQLLAHWVSALHEAPDASVPGVNHVHAHGSGWLHPHPANASAHALAPSAKRDPGKDVWAMH